MPLMEKPNQFDFTAWPPLPEPWLYSAPSAAAVKRIYQWIISGSNDLWPVLAYIRKSFQNLTLPNVLWFRGQTDKNYVLLPSLIRSYFDKGCSCSLPQYQKILLENFITQSGNSPELADTGHLKRNNEQIEYIADMQHYGVSTNLLDWSEDVSVPLYFATEKDIQGQAALYVLHPYFYNFVRNAIISLYAEYPLYPEDKFNHDTARASIGGLLPNFSAHFNLTAMQYQNYITGPETFHSLLERSRWRSTNPLQNRNTYAPLLPLALQVPRRNPRIRSQSGTFLAFNLCEFPLEENLREGYNCHGLEHIELEWVQKFYFTSPVLAAHINDKQGANFEAMRNKVPFLYKLLLNADAVRELRELVRLLGKRNDVVYPELYNIGKRIVDEAKGV